MKRHWDRLPKEVVNAHPWMYSSHQAGWGSEKPRLVVVQAGRLELCDLSGPLQPKPLNDFMFSSTCGTDFYKHPKTQPLNS